MFRHWRRLRAFVAIVILVLLGRVECRAQSATAETSTPPVLPANTPVILRLTENLYQKDAKPGQPLQFEVAFDVVVKGQLFIRSGTPVHGSLRRIDHEGKGPAKVLIDLGSARTVSGEMARLQSAGTSPSDRPGIGGAVGFVDEPMALPIVLPVLGVMKLFEKKVLLDKDAGCGWFGGLGSCGVWVVAHVAGNVALDPAKQEAAQEQYVANRKAAGAEICKMLTSRDPPNWERIGSLERGSGDANMAALLRSAGDLDGAIDVYQQLLAPKQDLPCSDKYPEISSAVPLLFFAAAVPEEREQWLKSSTGYSHLELAGIYREKGDFPRAVSECRTAVRLIPNDERARIGLIDTLTDAGDFDGALAEAKEALQMWPERPYFHYLLGRLLVKKNDPDAAIVELRWALKKEKNHLSPANCELGRAFELKGDPKAALHEYRVAVRAHGGDKECRAAYERLKLQPKN